MKFLVIGFLAFCAWSAFSTYIYVCKIKGFCNEPVTVQIGVLEHKDVPPVETMPKPLAEKQSVIPDNLVIHFAFDRSEFKSDAGTAKYFDESKAYLDQNQQARLSITGHTDAIGPDKYNQALGYRRAQNAQHYFEGKGMLSNRIVIESKGEKEPADGNNTKSGRANNRRTVITIIK